MSVLVALITLVLLWQEWRIRVQGRAIGRLARAQRLEASARTLLAERVSDVDAGRAAVPPIPPSEP